jgi:hypothetical protein
LDNVFLHQLTQAATESGSMMARTTTAAMLSGVACMIFFLSNQISKAATISTGPSSVCQVLVPLSCPYVTLLGDICDLLKAVPIWIAISPYLIWIRYKKKAVIVLGVALPSLEISRISEASLRLEQIDLMMSHYFYRHCRVVA